MTTPVIQVHKLSKQFGKLKAVDSVSLTVSHGEVYGFLGPNGAGKTTTIGMILGLIHAGEGEIRVFGEPVTPGRPHALKRVGALFGQPALLPYLSGRRNLELAARLTPGLPKNAIDRVLDLTGLVEAARRPTGQFSTGMKQRLGLAIALLHEPQLLILDEPTNGMDPAGIREIRQLIRGLAEGGVTVFLSSHLLHEVEQICDRVTVLHRGKVIAEGQVSAMLSDRQEVRVRVESPQKAAERLLSLPGAERVRPNGEWVSLRHPSSQAVNQHLAGAEIFAAEITCGRPDLETFFLDLTQD
jgi:ABC-type multidrug transport system ATPase subunit